MKEIETELGTMSLLLTHGGSITVTHNDDGLTRLSVQGPYDKSPVIRTDLLLDVREALTLVEFLAVALKPGSSSRIVEVRMIGECSSCGYVPCMCDQQ